ncbi:MAG: hypothetical protein EOO28_22055 [Comamonadaceae bacterium]|nr:MAG: hypothetical protein EOO28_22055 [Comamonadaceae bacterium]
MNRSLRRLARVFTSLYLLQTLLAAVPAHAQLSAAPGAPSGQKPLIDVAANDLPLVLIAPPSAAGVSRTGGGVSGFDVRAGVLNIGAGELSATGQQQLDLYARGLILEGDLWAQNLQAVIGANRVTHGETAAQAQITPEVTRNGK